MGNERTANELDRRLGARVRARRLALGISQEELAARLGITFQQVQKYENGTNRIASSRLFDIAQSLDTVIGAFFDAEAGQRGKSGRGAGPDLALDTPQLIELVRLFKLLKSAQMRLRVLNLVRALVDER